MLTQQAAGGKDHIPSTTTAPQFSEDLRIFGRHAIRLRQMISEGDGKPSLSRAEYWESGQKLTAIVKRYPPGSQTKVNPSMDSSHG
jgi:hypothetical protein